MNRARPCGIRGDALKIHVLTTGGTIDKEYMLEGNLEIGSPMASAVLAEAWTGRCRQVGEES